MRIHDDASARASARAVDALAYAVGNHVVLGGPSDDRLLAHELAHVVQQRGVKWTGGALPVGSASDPSEREAEAASHGRVSLRPSGAPRLARQRATPDAGTGSTQPAPAPPTVTVGSSGAQGTAGPPAPAQPPPPPRHCIPARPLTWADYPVRARAAWPAQTGFSGAVKGRGRAAYYEVRFDARSSWVLPKYVHPANRRSNGCAPLVQSCRRALASGRTWSFTPDQSCAASIHPTAVPTTVGECETVFGVDCDRAAVDESNRLLAHEQGHFDLACVIAGKATAALAAGATPQAVNDAFGNLTGSDSASLTSQYDDDTGHGCDATEQANWLQSIANGLPNTTVP